MMRPLEAAIELVEDALIKVLLDKQAAVHALHDERSSYSPAAVDKFVTTCQTTKWKSCGPPVAAELLGMKMSTSGQSQL